MYNIILNNFLLSRWTKVLCPLQEQMERPPLRVGGIRKTHSKSLYKHYKTPAVFLMDGSMFVLECRSGRAV